MTVSTSIVIISKDEPDLEATLIHVEPQARAAGAEVLVVDASQGRLDWVRCNHPQVRWFDYRPPPGVPTSIPHQRNLGVREAAGEIVAFVDCGCIPQPGWLAALIQPIELGVEEATSGVVVADNDVYGRAVELQRQGDYLREAPTITLAFRKAAFDAVGGFDETFRYGSDVDFTWRLSDAGFRIRLVRRAVICAGWGSTLRQLRRGRSYGAARVRLYRKHRNRLGEMWRRDPVPAAYGLYLLGLPAMLRHRWYPLLLLVPLWRARAHRRPVAIVAEHLAQGAGALEECVRWARRAS